MSTPSASSTPRLRLRNITKAYPSVIANDAIDIDVYPGEIHAVLGENGAGKSTLMKIIYGAIQPDAGELWWHGELLRIKSPAHARSLGIGMVYQHFSLFETLTVVENISLAVRGSKDDLSARIVETSDRFGLPVAPDKLVYSLSVGERQRVEIIRCLLQNPQLLIMDEPTSVLPPAGVTQLFDTLRQLAADGVSILYISHKMDEIRALCDTATVLRLGQRIGQTDPQSESTQSLARMMIGHDIAHADHPPASEDGAIRLAIQNLNRDPDDPFGSSLRNISLNVRAGEIVGIAGVSGNGQAELMELVSGEITLPATSGETITIDGEAAAHLGPIARRQRGLNFVPEDRLGRGAVGEMSLSHNGLLTGFGPRLVRRGLLRFQAMREFASRCIRDNDVRCGGTEATIFSLSGGNVQKFIVGREMALSPRLLVISQPTWGVDVGAAAAIRERLLSLRDKGVAVLIVSEELEELFEITDRLYVMFDGHLSPALRTRESSAHDVGEWMTGMFARQHTGSAHSASTDRKEH